MNYYNLTFENIDSCNVLKDYDIDIQCAVLHYGDGLKKHIHVVSRSYMFGYDGCFVYCKRIDTDIELYKFVKYLVNGHCNFEILSGENFIKQIESSKPKSLDLEDLIDEIVENIKLKRVRSHSYYLAKYGSVYLKNFKDIRYMFDMTSNFYEF